MPRFASAILDTAAGGRQRFAVTLSESETHMTQTRPRRLTKIDSLRKHPVLSAFQAVAFLIALPAFFSTVSFMNAVTPAQALADGSPLPSGWSAGVMNHGSYYHWWTIQERPLLFAVSVSCVVASVLFIWGSLFWLWRLRRKSTLGNETRIA
jgi:hypothetical protein